MENNKKASSVIKWILFALGVIATGITIFLDGQLFGESSIFNQTITENNLINVLYQKIPALIRTMQIIVLSMTAYYFGNFLLQVTFGRTNRGMTISKLCKSFLKWVVALSSLMFALSAWGIDTTTLLASAGIVTLIIGLGAQSLVADIVAGIFIVFESEFQVGDIVIINNWRGTVQEIGVRTTKIVDAGGNVNIINNSEITTIINQTQEESLAKCVVGIEYGESLTRVELVVKDNLEKIKENIPAILEGPYYKGVTMLNTSSVDLLFIAKCKEEDIFQVQRDLNREFKLLFDEHGINIPFPQVVLNQPSVFNTKMSEKKKKSAKEFLEEQKILSNDLESEEMEQ